MGQYLLRRVLFAIPTLIVISFIIFAVLELAPGDPTGALPETIRPEVRAMIREAMGLDKPMPIKYALWLKQFFFTEPLVYFELKRPVSRFSIQKRRCVSPHGVAVARRSSTDQAAHYRRRYGSSALPMSWPSLSPFRLA